MSTTTTAQLATSLLRQAATSLEAVGLHRGPGMWPGGRIYAQGAALSVDGALLAAHAAPHSLHEANYRDGDWSRVIDRRVVNAADAALATRCGSTPHQVQAHLKDWVAGCQRTWPSESEVTALLRGTAEDLERRQCGSCGEELHWSDEPAVSGYPLGWVDPSGGHRCTAETWPLATHTAVVPVLTAVAV